jgi:hypothetical protein
MFCRRSHRWQGRKGESSLASCDLDVESESCERFRQQKSKQNSALNGSDIVVIAPDIGGIISKISDESHDIL